MTYDNADAVEIEKFSDLASRWWDPDSEFKPLHQINPLRLKFIHERSPLNGRHVLDVGCGGGILSEAMAKKGAKVTGIDLAEASLNVARLHAIETGMEMDYRQIAAEGLAKSEAGEYDIVTCLEVLEHVPDPASVVTACASLTKPGGSIYFSTINRNPKSFLFAIVCAEYLMQILPKGTHQYEKLIKPSELCHWCDQAGLRVSEITGLHYNPLFREYCLGPGVDVNYMIHTTAD